MQSNGRREVLGQKKGLKIEVGFCKQKQNELSFSSAGQMSEVVQQQVSKQQQQQQLQNKSKKVKKSGKPPLNLTFLLHTREEIGDQISTYSVKNWKTEKKKVLVDKQTCESVLISPNGQVIAVCLKEKVLFFDAETEEVIFEILEPFVHTIQFSPLSTYFVTLAKYFPDQKDHGNLVIWKIYEKKKDSLLEEEPNSADSLSPTSSPVVDGPQKDTIDNPTEAVDDEESPNINSSLDSNPGSEAQKAKAAALKGPQRILAAPKEVLRVQHKPNEEIWPVVQWNENETIFSILREHQIHFVECTTETEQEFNLKLKNKNKKKGSKRGKSSKKEEILPNAPEADEKNNNNSTAEQEEEEDEDDCEGEDANGKKSDSKVSKEEPKIEKIFLRKPFKQQTVKLYSLSKKNYFAGYVEAKTNSPASIVVYKYPKFDQVSASFVLGFSNIQYVEMQWNKPSTALLVKITNQSDATDSSYYGDSHLFLIRANGSLSKSVLMNKVDQIHDFQWAPSGQFFSVIYGHSPSKISLFNENGDEVFDFGTGMRNKISWSPSGRLVAFCGFGSLNGGMDFWDFAEKKKIGSTNARNASIFDWCPDESIFMTSTVTPTLREENKVQLWKYNGLLLHQEMFKTLYKFFWRPVPRTLCTARAPSPKGVEEGKKNTISIEQTQAKSAYVPPHLRRSEQQTPMYHAPPPPQPAKQQPPRKNHHKNSPNSTQNHQMPSGPSWADFPTLPVEQQVSSSPQQQQQQQPPVQKVFVNKNESNSTSLQQDLSMIGNFRPRRNPKKNFNNNNNNNNANANDNGSNVKQQ